jgi:hypothetical protein
VENLVGFVKGSFFKVRRFQDEEDLEQQLGDWHREVNEERPLPGDGSRPCRAPGRGGASTASFEGAAGGAGPAYPGLRRPQGTVLRDGHAYSIPPEAISMPGTLYLYADLVRIVAGRHEAVHPRKFAPHEGSTLAAHRAALVAAVLGKRGKRYLKRQQMLDLGEPAFLYLTEIVHRRPQQWVGEVDRLHEILQSHGPEVLRRAMEEGLKEEVFSASYVERFLQRSLVFQEAML